MHSQSAHFLLSFVIASLLPSIAFSLPAQISPPGERMVLVDPREHAWGAYDPSGRLVRSGLASAGADYCQDVGRPCRTITGMHRVHSLGSFSCKSPSFPVPNGGAPMPYCMYFNKWQALHGSYQLANDNISHGCVRMSVSDARWLRTNFVRIGTLVMVMPY